jgi:hypothetical protein
VQDELLKTTKKSLIQSFSGTDWWSFVHSEIKEQIIDIIQNVDLSGSLFRNAWIALFSYSAYLRKREGINCLLTEHSALFGHGMAEEVFQCGKLPTKTILQIDGWIEINEADVQACIWLCHQIDMLIRLGVIQSVEKQETFLASLKNIILDV